MAITTRLRAFSFIAKLLASALIFFGLSVSSFSIASPQKINPPRIELPPQGHLYHAVYPGGRTGEEDDITPDDLSSFEQTVGKTAAWVYFSNNWYRDRSFPRDAAKWIREAGAVPFIRLMLLDSAERGKNHRFTLKRILKGDFDDDFRAWARGARDFGSVLLVEYGTEMNGEWFPWNGKYSGKGKKTGYGDRSFPDGPERFRDAYRRIIDLMREEGASNIMWVFHVNGDDQPGASWTRFENYYTGDDYVDWVGVSSYGALRPVDDYCDSFRSTMDRAYPRIERMAPSKPVVVLEFGVTSRNRLCNQEEWAEQALRDLTSFRWPRVIGFSWWNEMWENDNDPAHNTNMRVQDNPLLASAFRQFVGQNENILGRAIIR